jgi:probable phosphoglycerate mutase
MSIYLLRHGALASDSRDRFVGQIDLQLAPDGVLQAKAVGQALRKLNIDAIHCSDLLRSRQTADIIAGNTGIAVESHRNLREVSVGEWEGLSRREVAERFPVQYAARGNDIENYRIPGGESFADCRQRVLSSWNDIIGRNGKSVVIVGHAGGNRLLLCHLLGIPVARMFVLGQDYGRVNIVELRGERCCVSLINGRVPGL